MSLSNPVSKNPAERFIQWKGGAKEIQAANGKTSYEGGKLVWYDKEAEQENEIALPFSFIVLDELSTITGFSEKDQSGFWSNEVRNLASDVLTVKSKGGTVAVGVYGAISDAIKSKGAKYAKSVYIAFKNDEGELAIGNLKIAGAALTAWIEFQKKFDVEQCAVFVTDKPKLGKKGSNHYFMPVFEGQKLADSTKVTAVKLDEELQNYLNSYFNRKPDLDDTPVDQDDAVEIEDLPDKEEEANEQTVNGEAPAEPTQKPPKGGDDSINLADVPF